MGVSQHGATVELDDALLFPASFAPAVAAVLDADPFGALVAPPSACFVCSVARVHCNPESQLTSQISPRTADMACAEHTCSC